jgi:hypothetical protein
MDKRIGMRVFTAFMFFTLAVAGCISQTDIESVTSASRIVINSKGVNTPKDRYEVTDTVYVNEVIRELKKIDPYIPDSGKSWIPVKSNRGYFEVQIFSQDEMKIVFDVVYTTYYGVIIAMDNQYYKNDELEYAIIGAISGQQ